MEKSRKFINIEMKARCSDASRVADFLKSKNAEYVGTSRQTDTYFRTKQGRLKIREDPIQNLVIYYERDENAEAKQSNVMMFEYDPKSGLREILEKAFGVLVTVRKTREVYRIENVKFNIDQVEDLGSFVEIEADDLGGKIAAVKLRSQVKEYMSAFGISEKDIVNASYSDLLMRR